MRNKYVLLLSDACKNLGILLIALQVLSANADLLKIIGNDIVFLVTMLLFSVTCIFAFASFIVGMFDNGEQKSNYL